jgi:uncharacterized protein YeaC (DUF1315 family)
LPPPSCGGGKSPRKGGCAGGADRGQWPDAVATEAQKERGAMADQVVTNQKSILGNQKTILANQKTIVKNQDEIKKNQKALSAILANQKEILKNQKAILEAVKSRG